MATEQHSPEVSVSSPTDQYPATADLCLKDYAKIVFISIPSSYKHGNYVVYDIEVGIPGCMWRLSKRYSDFFLLNQQLQWFYSFQSDEMPKKKFIRNKSQANVLKRKGQLEAYLKHILRTFPILPPQFLNFINYQYYDVVGVTQALSSRLFSVGEKILLSGEPAILSIVQMYCITRRLKLPLESKSYDISIHVENLYDFVYRIKHLKIVADTPDCLSSSILSEMRFDLSVFRSLRTLQFEGCDMSQVVGWQHLFENIDMLSVQRSVPNLEMALGCFYTQRRQDALLNNEDCPPTKITPIQPWQMLTHVYLMHNTIKDIDEYIKFIPCVEVLDLSYNEIEEIPEVNLQGLSALTFLSLSHNHLENVNSLHTKLGNVTTLDLSYNRIKSLVGLRKFYCIVHINLRNNSIDDLSNLNYFSKLPCLETLHMEANPICFHANYRLEIFSSLQTTYETLSLDGTMLQPKEKTVVLKMIEDRPKYYYTDTPSQVFMSPCLSPALTDSVHSSSEGAKKPYQKRVAPIENTYKRNTGNVADTQYNVNQSEINQKRISVENLREKEGVNWLSAYNQQQSQLSDTTTQEVTNNDPINYEAPLENSALILHPDKLSTPFTELDIRKVVQERSDSDLTQARVSHVPDFGINPKADEQNGKVFMVELIEFQDTFNSLMALEESHLFSLMHPGTSEEYQHESMVVNVINNQQKGIEVLIISLDSGNSESAQYKQNWKLIEKLENPKNIICIEENLIGTSKCKILCLATEHDANELYSNIKDLLNNDLQVESGNYLVQKISPYRDITLSLSTKRQLSSQPDSNVQENYLTKMAIEIFETKLKNYYILEGFFSTRISSQLLTSIYYYYDALPFSMSQIEIFNSTDNSLATEDEIFLSAAFCGFVAHLCNNREIFVMCILTNKAVHILELESGINIGLGRQENFYHILTIRYNEISRVTFGLYEQNINFESDDLGVLGCFTLLTRKYEITQNLKQCLIANNLKIEASNHNDINELKKSLFVYNINDTYNSLRDEEYEQICIEAIQNIQLILYIIINEHRNVCGQDILCPVSIILTKDMLYLCIEDYQTKKNFKRSTFLSRHQIISAQPISAIDNIEMFNIAKNKIPVPASIENDVYLYFEKIESSNYSHRSYCWKLHFNDILCKDKFISSLKILWKEEFGLELKTTLTACNEIKNYSYSHSTTIYTPTITLASTMINDFTALVSDLSMPKALVTFAWKAARSPSAFYSILKQMSPVLKTREQKLHSVILCWCSPFTKPDLMIPVCVVLLDNSLFLYTTQHYSNVHTDQNQDQIIVFDMLNFAQIEEIVLGFFDFNFRIDTHYGMSTIAFITFDNNQTQEFLSILADLLVVPTNKSLLKDGDEEIPSVQTSELEGKFSLTQILLTTPSEMDLLDLVNEMQFEANKFFPSSLQINDCRISSYSLFLYESAGRMLPRSLILSSHAIFLYKFDLVRWPIPKFMALNPPTPKYEIVETIAFEWITRIEFDDYKSAALRIFFSQPSEFTKENSDNSTEVIESQPNLDVWNLLAKDYQQRNSFLHAIETAMADKIEDSRIKIVLKA